MADGYDHEIKTPNGNEWIEIAVVLAIVIGLVLTLLL